MKKKSLLILFGFLFGLCGMFCFDVPNFNVQATSTMASIWDGQTPESENDMHPGEWYYSNGAYHINSAAAFAYFASKVNADAGQTFDSQRIFLETDIDLNGKEWVPIGGENQDFAGTFDGKGHYIFGLNIQTNQTYAGLFGKIGGRAKISNLNLRNVSYSGDAKFVGGLVGEATSGSSGGIENCSVKGSLSVSGSNESYVGGLVGKFSAGTIQKCSCDVSMSSSNSNVGTCIGGLVGTAETTSIHFSNSFGMIESVGGYVGGLVGSSLDSQFENVFSVANLNCASQTSGYIGGLVGRGASSFSLNSAYYAGEIAMNENGGSTLFASGLVGYVSGSYAALQGLLMIGDIKVGGRTFDGTQSLNISPLWQKDASVQMSGDLQSYFDAEIFAKDSEQELCAVNDLRELAKTRGFYENTNYFDQNTWNFSENTEAGWRFGSGNNLLPVFNFTPGRYVEEGTDDFGDNDQEPSQSTGFRGQGTADSPFLIETAGDLARFHASINTEASGYSKKYFFLQNDINLSGKKWDEVANARASFQGIFDGNGHTISGIDGYLFGSTNGAVIKNLTVSDFTTADGGLVTYARDTYLVNCADKNATSSTIGNGSVSLFLGKNNLADITASGINSTLTTLKLSSSVKITRKGFDIAISGEGGNFFKTTTESGESFSAENLLQAVYFGEYHILLDENGQFASSPDTTFGKTALPGLSTDLGKTDVLIKRGSKLQGYEFKNASGKVWDASSKNWESGFSSINKQNLVNGLSAVWQGNAIQSVRLIYNSYEKTNFGTTSDPSAPYANRNLIDVEGNEIHNFDNSEIKIFLGATSGDDGLVYVDHVLEYDSFLEESDYIFEEPHYLRDGQAQSLRGDAFEFEGLYENSAFTGAKLDSNLSLLVNDNLKPTYYAQWKGTDKDFVTKIVFKTEDKGIVLSDAVESVKLLGFDGVTKAANGIDDKVMKETTGESISQDDELSFDLHYDTTFSDLSKNYLKFAVELNSGYKITNSGIKFDEESFDADAYDSNFGNPKFSVNDLSEIESIDSFNNIKYYNLLGDHTITFTLTREVYEDVVNIGNSQIFVGVGPNETFRIIKSGDSFSTSGGLSLGTSSTDKKDLVEFVKEHKKSKEDEDFDWSKLSGQNLKIAFDLVHERIMFSSQLYDSIEMDFSSFESSGIYFEINGKTYKISKESSTSLENGTKISLTNQSRGGVDEAIFDYNSAQPSNSKIQYRSFDSFVMIFSTEYQNADENEAVSFTTAECVGYDVPKGMVVGTSLKKFGDSGDVYAKSTKFMVEFSNVDYVASGKEVINVVTQYVQATFDFNFVHEKDLESGENTMKENSPTIFGISATTVETGTDGEISFYVESSDRFKLRNDSSLLLYSDGKNTLYPGTTANYNIRISVAQNGEDDSFATELNATNALYFNNSTIESANYKKGRQVNSHIFLNDGYRITLHFSSQLEPRKFEVTLVCTDQLYEVEYAARFLSQTELADLETSAGAERMVEDFRRGLYAESNSLVSMTGHYTSNGEQKQEGNSGNLTGIKFEDVLSLSTELGENKGYVFSHWILQSEGIINEIHAKTFEDAFSKIYQDVEMENLGNSVEDQFKLFAYAVYERKQVEVSLADIVQIEDETISMEEAGRKSVFFGMSDMTYVYGTSATPENVTITMSGAESDGYYLYGYRAVDAEGLPISDIGEYNADDDHGATAKKINLTLTWLKDFISEGKLAKNDSLEDGVQIVPILKEKTASLVFHSGTGQNNSYGDKLQGHVFDESGTETTDSTYTFSADLKFGDVLYIPSLSPNGQSTSVENLFHHRTGYSVAENGWAWERNGTSGTLTSSYFEIESSMFDAEDKSIIIHLYRRWSANQYDVTFHANTGTFGNNKEYSQLSVKLTYDQIYTNMASILTNAKIYPIEKNGNHILSWTLEETGGDKIFEANGEAVEKAGYFEGNKFVHAENFDVYAQWTHDNYQIKILFNKADSVVGQTDGATEATFSLTYNSSLDKLQIAEGLQGIDAFTNLNVIREGFVFNGVYAFDSITNTKTRITNGYLFNTSFPTFKLPSKTNEVAVTLYFDWHFDSTYFSLSARSSIPSLVYNSEAQEVSLADYFTEGNYESSGFEINSAEGPLVAIVKDVKSISLETELKAAAGSKAIINPDKESFMVTDAGHYSVILTVRLLDKRTDNLTLDSKFNLGELATFELTFEIDVQVATIDLAETITNELYLQNLKRLVGAYLSNVEPETNLKNSFLNSNSLKNACDVLKKVDPSVEGKSDEEIYQYFMTKFYLISHTTETSPVNAQTQIDLYKNWSYSDFESFCSENQEDFLLIQQRTDFFAFFDFSNSRSSVALKGWANQGEGPSYSNYVSLLANGSFAPKDLKIDEVEIFSSSGPLRVREEFLIRVFVSARDANVLKNYTLQTSAEEKCYFIASGKIGYIFPQIIQLQNSAKEKKVFYSSLYDGYRDVPWKMETDCVEIDEREYYLLGKMNGRNLYLSVDIRTSNLGSPDTDTTFRYTAKENYLYFSSVNVLLQNGDSFEDVTANFKFIIGDENTFVITNIKGVASVRVNASYLSQNFGSTIFGALPNDISASALYVSEVKYDGGSINAKGMQEGEIGELDGEILFQINKNNSNMVEIFVGNAVTEVVFAVQSLKLNDFVSLFKWSDQMETEITGIMTTEDAFKISKAEIEQKASESEDGFAEIDLYAIFTDLVKVTFEFGFPPEYAGPSTQISTLKLGEALTTEILPFVTGLGYASSLYVKERNGSLTSYEELNNFNLNGEMVFGGWNVSKDTAGNEFRFTPITFLPKWEVPDGIEHEMLLDKNQKFAVYTFSALNFYDVMWIEDANESIFEYEYSWSIKYDDNTTKTSYGTTIDLRDQGATTASGTYTLKLTRKVRNFFAGTFEGDTTVSIEESLHIQFMPYEVKSITPPENPRAVYDGYDHKNDNNCAVQITYVAFDNETQAYETEETELLVKYSENGLFAFVVTFEEGFVKEIVNVGEYEVTLQFMKNMFALAEGLSENSARFTYTITPLEFDLDGRVQNMQKRFNENDPLLQQAIEIFQGNVVTVQYRRDGDEDVGEKKLYFKDVLNEHKKNVDFKFNGSYVFKDGKAVENSAPVGKFTIGPSESVQIDLKQNGEIKNKVEAAYDGTAYALSIEDFTLKIKNGPNDFISLDISLYDMTKGEDLTGKDNLQFLKGKMSKIVASFFASQVVEARNAGIYNYIFNASGTEFENYYTSIVISNAYQFEIKPYEIKLDALELDKDFDGLTENKVDVDGYEDIQVQIVYAAPYAGKNVPVTLTILEKEGKNVHLGNYALESRTSHVEIRKLEATLTLATQNDKEGAFDYGTISANTISNFFKVDKIVSKRGEENLDTVLISGRYKILFDIAKTDSINGRGFLFAGTYSVKTTDGDIGIQASFDDFVMTINDSTLKILPLQKKLAIDGPIKTITNEDEFVSFDYVYSVVETGDDLTLKLGADGGNGNKFDIGQYALKIVNPDDYASGIKNSVVVTIDPPDNEGLNVIEKSGSVVLTIDGGLDSREYDGTSYEIEYDLSGAGGTNVGFKITNNAGYEKFYAMSATMDGEAFSDGFSISITFEKDIVKNADTYRLVVKATSGSYNFAFSEEYAFQITKKKIDASNLAGAFDRDYDGTTLTGEVMLPEKAGRIGKDEVFVSGRFDNANAGQNKTVHLIGITGQDGNNYEFDGENLETTSTINKAKATIAISETEFAYGKLTEENLLAGLKATVTANDSILMQSLYNLTVEITDATYSERGFLEVKEGGYAITISADSSSSTNYDFMPLSTHITLNPYELSLEFSQVIKMVEYGSAELAEIYENDGKFEYELSPTSSPLSETVKVKLKVVGLTSSQEVKTYFVSSQTGEFESLNKNYVLTKVDDKTGAFEIIKQRSRVYVLFDNSASKNEDKVKVSTMYDGKEYDSAIVKEYAGDWWMFLQNSSTKDEKALAKLAFFTLSGGNYVRYTNEIVGLDAKFTLSQHVKLVTNSPIFIKATNATSTSNQIKFGLDVSDPLYDYALSVVKRQLFYKTIEGSTTLTKSFTNQDAVFEYENASEMLTGIVDGDFLSLTVQFKDEKDNLAKYFSSTLYKVDALLSGEMAEQYEVIAKFESSSGEEVKGFIDRAEISVSFTVKEIPYGTILENANPLKEGEDYEFDFGALGDFDLTAYRAQGRSFEFSIEIKDRMFSTTNYLKAGEYKANVSLQQNDNTDFRLRYIIVDGVQEIESTSQPVLKIVKRTLTLAQKDKTLQEIFTREYDGTTDVKIFENEGDTSLDNLLFKVEGIVENGAQKDDVKLKDDAFYSSESGSGLVVTFNLDDACADSVNYEVEPFVSGIINPARVAVEFDFGDKTVTSDAGEKLMDAIAYPLAHEGSLSINAYSSDKNAFPKMLAGFVGHEFVQWRLHLDLSEDQTIRQTQISTLEDLQRYGLKILENIYEAEIKSVNIAVGDDSNTVRLLKEILKDDTFGLNFKNDATKIVFHADWEAEKFDFSIRISDENGNPSTISLGKVDFDGSEGDVEDSKSISDFFTFGEGKTITVRAYAKAHSTFAGFWIGNTKIEDGTLGEFANFTIQNGDDYVALVIADVVKDLDIVARFRLQKVTITLQVSDQDKQDLEIDGGLFDENLVWETNFFEVQAMTFAELPTLHIFGKDLVAYQIAGRRIEANAFSSTKLVENPGTEDINLILTPVFEFKTVAITLDYGHDEKYDEIYVTFGQAYSSATNKENKLVWEEINNPIRIGWTFEGWFFNNVLVTGESVVESEEVTLAAQWAAQLFSVEITLEHIRKLSFLGLQELDGKLVKTDAQYGDNFTIEIEAQKGYHLPDTKAASWDPRFKVELKENGRASISFKVDAENFEAKINADANQNEISFSGENVSDVKVFNVTDGEEKIEVVEDGGVSKFNLLSDKVVKFVVAPEAGFVMSENQNDLIFKTKDGKTMSSTALRNEGIEITKYDLTEDDGLIVEISGIKTDLQIVFGTKERENTITIDFAKFEAIEFVTIGEQEFRNPKQAIAATAQTGKDLYITIGFAHGYDLGEITVLETLEDKKIEQTSSELSDGRHQIVLSNIYSDATVTIDYSLKKYTISLNVTSYDKLGQKTDENENSLTVSDGGREVTSVAVDFGTKVTLNLTNAPGYFLSGWSLTDGNFAIEEDRLEEFGFEKTNGTWTYLVTDDVSIWVIFSQSNYTIELGTLDYASVTSGVSNIENQFIEIDGEYFVDELEETKINIIEDLAYGAVKTIWFNVPKNYNFAGFGFFEDNGTFKFLNSEIVPSEKISVTINTTMFGSTFVSKIFLLVASKEVQVHVESRISFKDQSEENFGIVGGVELSDAEGNPTNSFGYINGSRVHYLANDFESGEPKSAFNFHFVAYTQIQGYDRDSLFLKILAPRKGYVFDRIEISNDDLSYSVILETEQFWIIQISGIEGTMEEISIQVFYAPLLNIVDIGFVHNEHQTAGGLIEIETNEQGITKLWTSGNRYSFVTVSAYTDVKFSVSVYIGAGFVLDGDLDSCVDDPNHIIKAGTLRYSALLVEETGFSGLLTFDVADFVDFNQINIILKDKKYVVVFKDGTEVGDVKVLAKIHNVGFDTDLQGYLSQENSQNIEIFDAEFVNGELNLIRTREDYHFEGYFTYEKGAGRRYINSDGKAIGTWQETGFEYDNITGRYRLQKNAEVNENGETEISLYLYLSYFKTRIRFEFVPGVNTNYTAQDIVSGVDSTNSWFYLTNPNYIEISFNTDIYITAPELNGYKFYKFVINQRSFDGNWLTPAVFYENRMPWSTNEVDRIVECKIEIIYFAQLDSRVVGGDGKVGLSQQFDDEQAQALLEEGYFDTSKEFTIIAEPEEGYNFVRWEYQGLIDEHNSITLSSSRRLSVYLYLQGAKVTLNFADYDTTRGQIVSLRILGKTGNERRINNMVTYSGGTYVKNTTIVQVAVGDVVTFAVSMADEISVKWKDMPEIAFKEKQNGLSYFELTIAGEDAYSVLKIIPEFSNAYRVVYVSRSFVSQEIFDNALDSNDANSALKVFFEGVESYTFNVERGKDLEIDLVLGLRYEIQKITVRSNETMLNNIEAYLQDGKLILPDVFMTQNNFGGNLYIKVEVSRMMWEELGTESSKFNGAGTSKNPYHITNEDELLLFMKLVNSGAIDVRGQSYRRCNYVLDANLNLDERFWSPIGTEKFAFDGTFNFQNHTINGINLAVLYDEIHYNGLFGVLGTHAQIISGTSSWWWILLIILVVIILALIFVSLVYYNKKKKKEHETMATK